MFFCGCFGLACVLLPYLLMVSLKVWGCIAMVFVGGTLMLAGRAEQVLNQGCLHERLFMMMKRQVQVGQRLALLFALPEANLGDMQVIIADISPTVAALLGAQSLGAVARMIHLRLAGVSPLMPPPLSRARAGTSHHLAAAMAWLRHKRLSIGYDDQVRLYGLSQQASVGDCQVRQPYIAGPFAWAKRKSWEAQRGLSRAEATKQLCDVLLEVDLAFRVAHPHIAQAASPLPQLRNSSEPTPVKSILRCLCELAERRVPVDLDERMALAKRRLLLGAVLVGILIRLLRGSKSLDAVWQRVRRVPAGSLMGVSACAYLVALNLGLPPTIHALLPRALRELPRTVECLVQQHLDGPAPRLCRFAVQALTPPVAGSPFRQ